MCSGITENFSQIAPAYIFGKQSNKGIHQARVVQEVENAIHRINHYPVDTVVYFCWHLSSG